jgi:hypothetical protein
MKMLRHHHTPHQRKAIARPRFVENFQEHIPRPRGAKKWQPAITAARDEMQVVMPVAPFEAVSHTPNQRPQTPREKT